MGIMGNYVKSKPAVRRIEQQENHYLSESLGARKTILWTKGIEKSIPKDLMDNTDNE